MDLIAPVIAVLMAFIHYPVVRGGLCWLTKTRSGRCKQLYSINMSREDCCGLSYPSISWSPQENVTRSDLFYWALFEGGAPQCRVCHKTCRNVQCSPDRKCRVRRGQARCVCSPSCPRYMKRKGRVCGSDRKTYKNYCTMLKHNCRYNLEVKLSYFGNCKNSCDDVKCAGSNHYCLKDHHALPHCVTCNTRCPTPKDGLQICGEDGVTYQSYCHLVSAICKHGEGIKVAYKGTCMALATCEKLDCPEGFKCLVNISSGLPMCSKCPWVCQPDEGRRSSAMTIALCGTDGLTYTSYCQMQQSACRRGIVIKTARFGPCEGSRRRLKIWQIQGRNFRNKLMIVHKT